MNSLATTRPLIAALALLACQLAPLCHGQLELISTDAQGNPGTSDSGVRLNAGLRFPERATIADDGTTWFLSEAEMADADINGVIDLYRDGGVVVRPEPPIDGANLNRGLVSDAASGHKLWLARPQSSPIPNPNSPIDVRYLSSNSSVTLLTNLPNLSASELAADGSAAAYTVRDGGGIDRVYLQTLLPTHLDPIHITDGANGNVRVGGISADGNVIVLESAASNLETEPDTNGVIDVYRYDAGTDSFTRLSTRTPFSPDDILPAESPHVSADGNVIVFQSADAQIAPIGDADDGSNDLFLAVGDAAPTRLPIGEDENTNLDPRLNSDGRYVVYRALGPDLTHRQVHLYDRLDGSTRLISVNATGNEANADCFAPAISPSGRYVSFTSIATNLATASSNGVNQVYRFDRGARFANLAPVLESTFIRLAANDTANFTPPATDPDSDPLQFTVTALPDSGTLTTQDGSAIQAGTAYPSTTLPWQFTGAANTSFSLVADDGLANSATATISVRIIDPVNGTVIVASPADQEVYPIDNRGLTISGAGHQLAFVQAPPAGGFDEVAGFDLIADSAISFDDPNRIRDQSPALSADGNFLALATSVSGKLQVQRRGFGISAPQQSVNIDSPGNQNAQIAISGDGSLIAFVADGSVHLWDVDAGAQGLSVIATGANPALSQDGNWLTWEDAGTVHLRAVGANDDAFTVAGTRPKLSAFGNRLLYRDAAGSWQLHSFVDNSATSVVAAENLPAQLAADGSYAIIYKAGDVARYDLRQNPAQVTPIGTVVANSLTAVNDDGSIVAFSTEDALDGTDQNAHANVYVRDFGPVANTAPTPFPNGIAVNEDERFAGPIAAIFDPDGHDTLIELVTPPQLAVEFSFTPPSPATPGGMLVYDSVENYFGNDAIVVRYRDFHSDWQEATIPITVAPTPDPPTLTVERIPFVIAPATTTTIAANVFTVSDPDEPTGITAADYQLELRVAPAGSLTDSDGAFSSTAFDKLPLTYQAPAQPPVEDTFQVRIRDNDNLFSPTVVVRVLANPAAVQTTVLNPGWSFISLPADPVTDTFAQEFLDIPGLQFSRFSGRRWLRSRPDNLTAGQGIAVFAKAKTTLTIPLEATATEPTSTAGWNLVGATGTVPQALPAGTLFAYRLDNRRRRLRRVTQLPVGEAVLLFKD